MEIPNRFTLEKIYHAPIELVWKAITDRAHIKQWSFDFPEGFKLEVGSQFDWYGGPPDGKQWLHRGKMLEIVEGKKLVHSWEYPGYTGLSTVKWELSKVDDSTTKVHFTHIFDIPFDPNEDALRRENFAAGWDSILNSGLVDFLKNQVNN